MDDKAVTLLLPAAVVVCVIQCKVIPLQFAQQVLLHVAARGLQGPVPAQPRSAHSMLSTQHAQHTLYSQHTAVRSAHGIVSTQHTHGRHTARGQHAAWPSPWTRLLAMQSFSSCADYSAVAHAACRLLSSSGGCACLESSKTSQLRLKHFSCTLLRVGIVPDLHCKAPALQVQQHPLLGARRPTAAVGMQAGRQRLLQVVSCIQTHRHPHPAMQQQEGKTKALLLRSCLHGYLLAALPVSRYACRHIVGCGPSKS